MPEHNGRRAGVDHLPGVWLQESGEWYRLTSHHATDARDFLSKD